MKLALVSLLGCLAVYSLLADETNTLPTVITVDRVTYSNVTWGAVTPGTVTIFHKTGIARIALEKLPPELQRRFGYNAELANKYLVALNTAEAARIVAERRQALFEESLKQYANQDLPDPLQVGAIGKLGRSLVVLQVLDANRMLLHRLIQPNPYTHTPARWSSPFCLKVPSTSNYADGQNLELAWRGMVVKVTGTMAYESLDGQRTVFVLEPYSGQ